MPRSARGRGERGSASVELSVVAPAAIAFLVVMLSAGRMVTAHQAVEAAAFDAARTASLSRDADAAARRAREAAADSLADRSVQCVSREIVVDTLGFAVPVGQPATVTVTITCVVALSDIALPGMPGDTRVTARFTSPLDQYRSRS